MDKMLAVVLVGMMMTLGAMSNSGPINAATTAQVEQPAIAAAGVYVGGFDLPVGSYTLTATITKRNRGSITLYAAGYDSDPHENYHPFGDYEDANRLSWKDDHTKFDKYYSLSDGEEPYTISFHIPLAEGDTLVLDFPCTITPYPQH